MIHSFTRLPRAVLAALVLLLPAAAVAQDDAAEDDATGENPVVIAYGDQVERLDAFEVRFEIALRNLAASQGQQLTDQLRARLSALQPQFLEQRAQEVALIAEARNRGMEIDEAAVDEQVEQARANVPEGATFDELLQQSGIESEETLRTLIGENQLISNLVEELQAGIEVPEEELRSAYEERQDEFTTPEQVCASHILLETVEDAEAALAEVEGGADFADVAQERSTGPSASEGGDLGCFGREQMVAPFADAAFEAEAGDVIGPVETEFGQHVIHVREHNEAGQQSFEEVRDQLESELSSSRVQAEIEAVVEEVGVETFPDRLPQPEVPESAPAPEPEAPEPDSDGAGNGNGAGDGEDGNGEGDNGE